MTHPVFAPTVIKDESIVRDLLKQGYRVGGVLRRFHDMTDSEFNAAAKQFDQAINEQREKDNHVVVFDNAFGKDWLIAPTNKKRPNGSFYTASKVKHAGKWQDLLNLGYPVIATWIHEAGEGQSKDYGELATRCVQEINESDFLLLYTEPDEVLKGALMEAGMALAFGKPVHCIGENHTVSRVFRKHPLWNEYATLQDALEKLFPSQTTTSS